ncbi:MAG TPA: isochorismatase family protein [Jatrophihabitans sp.]
MTQRIWDAYLTSADKRHLGQGRPKTPYGFGLKTAVLSVDNYRAAIGDEREPMMDSIKKWPNSTGLAGWEALDKIADLLAAARAAGLPVIHVKGMAAEDSGIPGWRARRGERGTIGEDEAARDRYRRRYDIVEQARPLPGEVVLAKTAPSAFFGTPLMSYLMGQGIDTLIVVGEAVSGCVRATVVDGCSYRLRMIVVEDCVYDRHEATRAMNLFDIDQKYGDVISLSQTLKWIADQPGSAASAGASASASASASAVKPDHEHSHEHAHDHDHDADHSHHSHIGASAHDHDLPFAELPLPAIVARALPENAVPAAVSQHPIHGHVLRRAGNEVLEAARAAMSSGYGNTPHVIVALSDAELEPDDDPRYVQALGMTDGGAVLVGVGYALAGEERKAVPSELTADPGSCPECGSTNATPDGYIEPRDTPGFGRGAILFFCEECHTAWDMPAVAVTIRR